MASSIRKPGVPTPRRRAHPIPGDPARANLPRVWKFTLQKGTSEYELELTWDDAAYARGELSCGIAASHMLVGVPNSKRSLESSVSVELGDDDKPVLKVAIGTFKASFNLEELVDETQVLDAIPAVLFAAGDPITGCLIRSGLSAFIAQIIHCKNSTEGSAWNLPRCRAIGACLVSHVPSICGRAAYRAAKCVAAGGLA